MSPLENVPRREVDIEEFSENMLKALESVQKNFEDYKNAKKELDTLLDEYRDSKVKQAKALELYETSTNIKDEKLEDLVKKLRSLRKQADKLDNADQKKWSAQFESHENTNELPGAPRDIIAQRDSPGTLHIEWRRPKRGSGGKVLFYEVVIKDDSATTGWQIVATTDAQTREVMVKDQPEGEELVYYVFAKNRNGRSPMVEDPIRIIL